MAAKIRISNIQYLKKQVKDYQKPFRFTLSLLWNDAEGREHGVDLVGNVAGVGRDGVAEWRGPMFYMGRKPSYIAHYAPGTYEAVLKALTLGGYFKIKLDDLLGPATMPTSAEEEVGLPGELDVQ